MTAQAAIKQADLRRMAIIAKQEGVKIEMEVNGRTFRVSADDTDDAPRKAGSNEPIRL